MMWFDKDDPRAIYFDNRRGSWAADVGTESTKGRSPVVVAPDVQGDFTEMPFPDGAFSLVVFDPPHIAQMEETAGILLHKYGCLLPGWQDMLARGFAECFRVLRDEGTLIFKWAESQIPVADVLALTPEKPLFGHRSGSKAKTHWIAFLKQNSGDIPQPYQK